MKKLFKFLQEYVIIPIVYFLGIYIFISSNNCYVKIIILCLMSSITFNYFYYLKSINSVRKSLIDKLNFYLNFIIVALFFLFYEKIKTSNFIYLLKINSEKREIYKFLKMEYIYYSIVIYLIILILYNTFFKNCMLLSNSSDESGYLLSFRKKELEKLEKMVNDKNISSILIEGEMGNGKSTLIDSLLKKLNTEEIIYFKLPLVKNIEELEKNLFLELQKIFIKYDLDNQFIESFVKNISGFKFGCFEVNFGNKENNWNAFQKLQKTIDKVTKNIIIILDDVEREENFKKIHDSVVLLGELAEYFKGTKCTVLFLCQYNYLKEAFGDKNLYIEKYIKYNFKLHEPSMIELEKEDLVAIIKKLNQNNLVVRSKNKSSDEFIESIADNIKNFFEQEKNRKDPFDLEEEKDDLLNIRRLEKCINKILYLYEFYKNSYISYSVFIFCILQDEFLGKMEEKEFENTRMNYYNNSLKIYSIKYPYLNFKDEIKFITNIYRKGEVVIDKIDSTSNIIKEILEGKRIKDKDFSILILGYEEYINNLISNNIEKFEIALENDLVMNKTQLIKLINNLNLSNFSFSEKAIEKMKKILMKREYTGMELLQMKEKEPEIGELPDTRVILIDDYERYCKNLKEKTEVFINKIKNISSLKNEIKPIKDFLKKDNEEKIKESQEETEKIIRGY